MDLSRLLNLKSSTKLPEKPPTEAPIGSGIANKGKEILQSLPYQKHLKEAEAMGFKPMTPEEFAQAMGVGR